MDMRISKMINECNTLEDFVNLYEKLEEMEEIGQCTITDLKYVEDRIGSLAGIQGKSVRKTLLFKDELDKAKKLIDECLTKEDFKKIPETMKASAYADEVIEKALEYGGIKLQEKFPDDIEKYNKFVDAKPAEKKDIIIGGIVLVLIGFFIIPIVCADLDVWLSLWILDLEINASFIKYALLILGGLIILGAIGCLFGEHKVRGYKKTYLEIQELAKLGYKVEKIEK